MGRKRKDPNDGVDVVYIHQRIKCCDHPDIADLYRANHARFVTAVREALSIYAFIQKTTGARTLTEMMSVLSSGGMNLANAGRVTAPAQDSRSDSPVGHSDEGVVELSSEAAKVLMNYERNM